MTEEMGAGVTGSLSLLWSGPVIDIFHSMKLHSVDSTENKTKLPAGCPKVCHNVYHSRY